jgi:hypothetical protein
MAQPVLQVGNVKVDTGSVFKALTDLDLKTADLRPVFANTVDPSLTQFFLRQFATEGKAGGEPWPGLKPRTLQARKRPGHGRGGILRDTGRLWAGYTKSGGPGSVREIGRQSYVRGVSVAYAQYHYPKRPVVVEPMPDYLTELWATAVANHLLG